MDFIDFFGGLEGIIPILRTILIVAVVYLVFKLVSKPLERELLRHAKNKKQVTNVELFSQLLNYVLIILLLIFAIFSYVGSWEGLGLGLGLFSAALGFALQKPIAGIVAWLMIITRRPFEIGDRIIIGNVKGDVQDITIMHIYLRELGGLISSESNSGRMVLVPNSVLFEQNVINYTSDDEFVLHEVVTTITYESNLDKALEICLDAAKKFVGEFEKQTKRETHTRTYFQASGINVHVRYFVPTRLVPEISSDITKEIFSRISKIKEVEIAYPHLEVLHRPKASA
ncbi:mechanosensitive ion channel family protein [Candidatus Micrarchaeota archaeon]|nr:mechanosensitive ion channel family protein [Candidatus Micrarchaeota archaeon]